jgi:hypothetical protein
VKEYFHKVVDMLLSSRHRLRQQQINAMNERIATLEKENRELRTQLHEAQWRQSVMADDDQNKKDDGMSQGVATIYRALFEELRFAKQQQWMTTNYLLLVLAAIFGIGKAIDQLTVCEKVIGTFPVNNGGGIWLLRAHRPPAAYGQNSKAPRKYRRGGE